MNKLALALSLLALGALGLAACGGDDDEATAASETESTVGSGGEAVTVEDDPGNNNRLSDEEKIEQTGNQWAPLFAADRATCRYMTQPACEWKNCKSIAGPIKNCTPPSAGFRKSFEDATVQDTAIKGDRAAARFSNGEVVEFHHASGYELGGLWLIHKFGGNAWTAASETESTVESGGEAVTVEADPGATNRLSLKERIAKKGNDWAALFGEGGFKPGLCSYMGQPACERMGCERVGNRPITNCTPVSAEFRESFADATVERVVVSEDHHHATAEFSNGELVEFKNRFGQWWVAEGWIKNAGRT